MLQTIQVVEQDPPLHRKWSIWKGDCIPWYVQLERFFLFCSIWWKKDSGTTTVSPCHDSSGDRPVLNQRFMNIFLEDIKKRNPAMFVSLLFHNECNSAILRTRLLLFPRTQGAQLDAFCLLHIWGGELKGMFCWMQGHLSVYWPVVHIEQKAGQ